MKPLVLSAVLVAAVASAADGPLAAPKVRLVPARPVQSSATEVVTGQLGPSRMLPLGFEVGGRLAVSRVNKGDQVKAGQPLGSLDTEIIDAQVAQAEAGLAAAEAAAALAQDVAGRNEKLKAEGSVSDVQSRQTETQAKAAAAQVAQAKAALAQARAGQRRHHLRALFAGTVIDAPDTVGGMVGPGTPVYIIMQLDPLILKATISEKFKSQVTVGQKVRVESVGSDAAVDDAIIKVVLPSADPQTRRVPVEVLVPNADGRFVANTLAKLTLSVGGEKSAVIIPPTALGMMGGAHVFVVDGAGKLKRVKVTVLERTSSQVTVVPEEPVQQVVEYPSTLVEGTKVTQR
ncbi:MAG: efflux RND transporter periplasmic adaptor subunit [Myxococcota bacterium]